MSDDTDRLYEDITEQMCDAIEFSNGLEAAVRGLEVLDEGMKRGVMYLHCTLQEKLENVLVIVRTKEAKLNVKL